MLPNRGSSSPFIARWASISSASSRSKRVRLSRYQIRRQSSPIGPSLRGSQHGADRRVHPFVVVHLRCELTPARSRESVETHAPIGFGNAPLGFRPSLDEDALERRIE